MNVRRMKLMIEAIRAQEEKEQFDLRDWGPLNANFPAVKDDLETCDNTVKINSHPGNSEEYLSRIDCYLIDPVHAVQCTSAACALGSAAIYPPLFDEGLRLCVENNRNHLSFSYGDDFIYFDGHTNFEAGAAFFDISYEESACLFDPGEYVYSEITADMVITRINKLIEQYENSL